MERVVVIPRIYPSSVPVNVSLPLFTEPEIPKPARVDIKSSTVVSPVTVTMYWVPLLRTVTYAVPVIPSSSRVDEVLIVTVSVLLNLLESSLKYSWSVSVLYVLFAPTLSFRALERVLVIPRIYPSSVPVKVNLPLFTPPDIP